MARFRHEIETPALVLDLDLFESNLARMAAHCRAHGKALRPHAKAHKCVEVARRQIAAGAAGVCVATVDEASWMARAGVPGILLTSPLASMGKMRRLVSLGAGITVTVDHPAQLEMWSQAASEAGVTLPVLIDLDVGDHRTGIACGAPAIGLARQVRGPLALRGLQAYSVSGSHTETFEARKAHSLSVLAPAIETWHALKREGFAMDVLSGGSTGTWNIDSGIPELTELQAGSYVFHDMAYARIGVDFQPALRIASTVISANVAGRVTIDAGFKALSADRPFPPAPYNRPGLRYQFAGDEFGFLLAEGGELPKLGEQVEMLPPHIDPTVNLYTRIHACRGERVEEIWEMKQ
jgi:D-serine deaminase-like pyridoxal phosphate-dependent protein